MNKKVINLFEIDRLDLEKLEDGVYYIIDNNMKEVGIIMNIKYYNYLESLMFKLRDKILKGKK